MDPVSGLPQPGDQDRERQQGVSPGATATLPRAAATLLGDRAVIHAMAEELERPLEEITRVYCEELAQLRSRAKVLDYLPVLVAKRVRSLYRKLRGSHTETPG
jgi:hypothetical protein